MSFEDLEKSLQGDGNERAEMRTIIESLALQLRLTSLYIVGIENLKRANNKLADAALEYLQESEQT